MECINPVIFGHDLEAMGISTRFAILVGGFFHVFGKLGHGYFHVFRQMATAMGANRVAIASSGSQLTTSIANPQKTYHGK